MKEEPSGAYVHQTLLRHDGRPCSHLLHRPFYHNPDHEAYVSLGVAGLGLADRIGIGRYSRVV